MTVIRLHVDLKLTARESAEHISLSEALDPLCEKAREAFPDFDSDEHLEGAASLIVQGLEDAHSHRYPAGDWAPIRESLSRMIRAGLELDRTTSRNRRP